MVLGNLGYGPMIYTAPPPHVYPVLWTTLCDTPFHPVLLIANNMEF